MGTLEHRMVRVTWADSYAETGWSLDPIEPITVISVGVLVSQDEKKTVLAGMCGNDFENYNNRQAIPAGCIQKIEFLEVADGSKQ